MKPISNLKEQDFDKHTAHCTIKYLNNFIVQDHRHVKRHFAKSTGFQNLRHASHIIKGIETIHTLYKRKRSLKQPNFVFLTYKELQQLFMAA